MKSAQARDYLALQCHKLVYLKSVSGLKFVCEVGAGFH